MLILKCMWLMNVWNQYIFFLFKCQVTFRAAFAGLGKATKMPSHAPWSVMKGTHAEDIKQMKLETGKLRVANGEHHRDTLYLANLMKDSDPLIHIPRWREEETTSEGLFVWLQCILHVSYIMLHEITWILNQRTFLCFAPGHFCQT